jgi:hypothetical protein
MVLAQMPRTGNYSLGCASISCRNHLLYLSTSRSRSQHNLNSNSPSITHKDGNPKFVSKAINTTSSIIARINRPLPIRPLKRNLSIDALNTKSASLFTSYEQGLNLPQSYWLHSVQFHRTEFPSQHYTLGSRSL